MKAYLLLLSLYALLITCICSTNNNDDDNTINELFNSYKTIDKSNDDNLNIEEIHMNEFSKSIEGKGDNHQPLIYKSSSAIKYSDSNGNSSSNKEKIYRRLGSRIDKYKNSNGHINLQDSFQYLKSVTITNDCIINNKNLNGGQFYRSGNQICDPNERFTYRKMDGRGLWRDVAETYYIRFDGNNWVIEMHGHASWNDGENWGDDDYVNNIQYLHPRWMAHEYYGFCYGSTTYEYINCETSMPTEEPTKMPTLSPTYRPGFPTPLPTLKPTFMPSPVPTPKPTFYDIPATCTNDSISTFKSVYSFKDEHFKRFYYKNSLLRVSNLTLVSNNDILNVDGGIQRQNWYNPGGCSLHDSVKAFIKDAPYLTNFEATLNTTGTKVGMVLTPSRTDCGWNFAIQAQIWDGKPYICLDADFRQDMFGWTPLRELTTGRCTVGRYGNANKLKISKKGDTITVTAIRGENVEETLTYTSCYVSKISGYPGFVLGPASTVKSAEIRSICLPGHYDASAGGTPYLLCLVCPAGTYSDGSTYCNPCPRGSVSGAGASKCTPCSSGYVTFTPGSISCTPCSSGRYSSSNRTSCLHCSDGKLSGNAASDCSICSN